MTDQPPRQFVCLDCGVAVFSFAVVYANDQDLCMDCLWLRGIEDPVERQRLRDFLKCPLNGNDNN